MSLLDRIPTCPDCGEPTQDRIRADTGEAVTLNAYRDPVARPCQYIVLATLDVAPNTGWTPGYPDHQAACLARTSIEGDDQ